jgi:hypothetical protein
VADLDLHPWERNRCRAIFARCARERGVVPCEIDSKAAHFRARFLDIVLHPAGGWGWWVVKEALELREAFRATAEVFRAR